MALLSIGWAARGAEAEPVGFLSAVQGEIRIEKPDGRVLEELTSAAQLFEGDIIVTGPHSRAKVLFADDSILAVGPESRVKVEQYLVESGSRQSLLRLAAGKVRALISRIFTGSKSHFRLAGPTAVAGVRGTEFIMVADSEGERVYTLEGEVEVSSPAGEERVVIAADNFSAVLPGLAPSAPVAVARAELERLRKEVEPKDKAQAVAFAIQVNPARDLWRVGLGPHPGQRRPAKRENGREGRKGEVLPAGEGDTGEGDTGVGDIGRSGEETEEGAALPGEGLSDESSTDDTDAIAGGGDQDGGEPPVDNEPGVASYSRVRVRIHIRR